MSSAIAFGFLLAVSLGAQAESLKVNCGGKGALSSINSALKLLNPQGPNTLKISGTCTENVTIYQFDRLSLIAMPGAVIQDSSGGERAVINISDSRAINLQGFTIAGGAFGVMCFDGSLCRFSGNTIERSTNAGVWVNNSQATFSGDIIQDTGDPGLAIEASKASAGGLVVQRSSGAGVHESNGSVLETFEMNIRDNAGDGIAVVDDSHMFLGDSTVSNNVGSGIDIETQSEVLLLQSTVTTNGFSGVFIGDLSLAAFIGGSFTGNPTDISCGGQFSVAKSIQSAAYGTTDCPVSLAQALTTKQNAPRLPLLRPPAR
jgi:hypothetical protein